MTKQIGKTYKFCGKTLKPEDFDLVKEIVTEFGLPRSEIADTVCELLEWKRPTGKLKTVECLKFLIGLEEDGHFTLPVPKNQRAAKPRRAKRTAAGATCIQRKGTLKDLGAVKLELIETKKERENWKELIDRHHYLGYRVPFGASLRYFIKSEKDGEVLGCLQFSSPAWKVEGRDRWIGWDADAQGRNLQRVIQNSRFLILPGVRVRHLASHVLGKVSKVIADDWEAAYKVRPVLLETFVDENRFKGTCYKAANWLNVGRTKGRGRMDRHTQENEPVKSIWVYPLEQQWNRVLTGQGPA